MKKSVLILLSILLCFSLFACAKEETGLPVSGEGSPQEQNSGNLLAEETSKGDSVDNKKASEMGKRELKLVINGGEYDVTLYDTPAADGLYHMLPLELTFEDFNGIEKIAYMDKELPTAGEPDEFDPNVGDLCLYAPWGNLSVFYKDFRNSKGLISLGHIDSGIEVIGNMNGDFSAILKAE